MTAIDLKNALLQEAVQGKLVPQIASEGNARDLLEEIRKERGESLPLATARKRSSATPSAGTPRNAPMEITEDEIPFDIPESWCWCRLGEVINLLSGQDFEPQFYNNKGNGIPYITGASNIDGEHVIINRWTETPKNIALKNDLLLVCKGSGYGTTVIADFDKAHIARQIMSIRSNVNLNYIRLFISTKFKYLKSQGKGLIPGIDRKTVLEMLFPLPPLAEQKRIVEAIEKFMPLIEEYGKKETVLNELNAQIGTLTKKAILQEAVQGKLVPQIPAEGNAKDLLEQIKAQKTALIKEGKIKKEKPLPEITEDEIPFDIPENWCWCRLSEYLDIRDGTHDSPKFFDVGIPFVTSKNLNNGILDFTNCKFITEEDHKKFSSRSFVENGDILFAMIGSIGNPVIVKREFDFSFKNMALFKRYSERNTNMKYVYYYLCHIQTELKKIATGGVQSFIGLGTFREMLFPLPPLAEQKRIVAAIEQLLPLCEKLGK